MSEFIELEISVVFRIAVPRDLDTDTVTQELHEVATLAFAGFATDYNLAVGVVRTRSARCGQTWCLF